VEADLDAAPAFEAFLEEVREFWVPLDDKPDRALRSGLPSLDVAAADRLRVLIERRRAGEPLAHLTGRQGFMGLEFLASPEALIPRKETEILGRAALAKLTCMARPGHELTVLDVCTGSGNLAIAYAYYIGSARVYASDLCAEAVSLARRNCEHFPVQMNLAERLELRQGDLLEPFDRPEFHGKCDLVSCNPPYISAGKVKQMHPEIANFEPQAAFNGGVYGVSILMKLIREAPRFLKPGGWLGFEVGSGQGPVMARQLEKHPAYTAVETCKDPSGEIRALFAKAAAAAA